MRILIVDDNRRFAQILGRSLSLRGAPVCVVASAPEALEQIIEGGLRAIVVDAALGEASGANLIVEARRRAPQVLTILMSGLDRDVLEAEAARCGAHHSLSKPFGISELEALLTVSPPIASVAC
jgi:DNA-binding response OmpR family regulator